ncbi:AHH domain-containing protein [Pseudomonas sp. Sample_16]|nr:AHH domain-containing protein [Pseudomonas sp. Sample_16]
MFGRLKKIGWDPDGASNGIFLPGSKDLAKTTGMPGHWSNHGQYTEAVKNKLVKLNNNLNSLTRYRSGAWCEKCSSVGFSGSRRRAI